MSADRQRAEMALIVVWGLIGCSGVVVAADEDELPDLDFLEYLGSWEGSDDEWTLFHADDAEPVDSETVQRNDPAPDGKESTESENES